MTVEQATFRAVPKPWGRKDLRPWNRDDHGSANVGEVWFGRPGPDGDDHRLLLKILFTSEPLSIQVHPDDTQAQAAGEANGKTEAWYVLAADPDARVGLGPKRSMTAADLRASVDEGRVADIVQWLPAVARDVFVVPAGTIHAIGPGLVVVEIQQRSDLTYRLFDHGRLRGLQVEKALAIATLSPAARAIVAIEVNDCRSAIAVTPFFVLERLELAVGSSWQVEARHETWLLVLAGEIEIAGISAAVGQAIFIENERAVLVVGIDEVILLIAYAHDRPEPDLIRSLPAAGRDQPAPIGATLSRREPAAFPPAVTELLP